MVRKVVGRTMSRVTVRLLREFRDAGYVACFILLVVLIGGSPLGGALYTLRFNSLSGFVHSAMRPFLWVLLAVGLFLAIGWWGYSKIGSGWDGESSGDSWKREHLDKTRRSLGKKD